MENTKRWPPVIGGVVIGLIIILAFVTAGRGIGASGAITRLAVTAQDMVLPDLTWQVSYLAKYFAHDVHPLNNYLVFLMVGIIAGGFVAALTAKSLRAGITRGPRISNVGRLSYALVGGILVGFAARVARGCAGGLGLVGGAQLSVGAWIFMVFIFLGGFAAAYFVRRQWL